MSHPNLSDEINRNIIKSEIDGGVYLSTPATAGKVLPVGKTLLVQTVNSLYRIEKRGEDDFYISGHEKFYQTGASFAANSGEPYLRTAFAQQIPGVTKDAGRRK